MHSSDILKQVSKHRNEGKQYTKEQKDIFVHLATLAAGIGYLNFYEAMDMGNRALGRYANLMLLLLL